MAWFDDTKYLDDRTRKACDQILQDHGLVHDFHGCKPGIKEPHVKIYEILKEELYTRELAGKGKLRTLRSPRGGTALIKLMTAQATRIANNLEEGIRARGQDDLPVGEEVVLEDEADGESDGEKEEERDDGVYFEPAEIPDLI